MVVSVTIIALLFIFSNNTVTTRKASLRRSVTHLNNFSIAVIHSSPRSIRSFPQISQQTMLKFIITIILVSIVTLGLVKDAQPGDQRLQ